MSIHNDIKIKSIKKKKFKGKVYNFAVSDDESYVANDIVVHNCRCTLIPVIGELKSKTVKQEKKVEPDIMPLYKKINKLLEDE